MMLYYYDYVVRLRRWTCCSALNLDQSQIKEDNIIRNDQEKICTDSFGWGEPERTPY